MDSKNQYVFIAGRKVYAFLLVLMILWACQNPGKSGYETYKGRLVRFSFDRYYEYGLNDYFFIDRYVIAHQKGPFENRFPEDTILVPPKKMVYLIDTSATGQKLVNANYIQMALALNEGIERLNLQLSDKDQYMIEEKPRMLVQGEITLRKRSGKRFEILVPEGYPLQVTILEK